MRARRKGLADVGERQEIVAGERRVVEDREQQRQAELRWRRPKDISGELVPRDRAQLDAKHLESDEKQHESDRDRDDAT